MSATSLPTHRHETFKSRFSICQAFMHLAASESARHHTQGFAIKSPLFESTIAPFVRNPKQRAFQSISFGQNCGGHLAISVPHPRPARYRLVSIRHTQSYIALRKSIARLRGLDTPWQTGLGLSRSFVRYGCDGPRTRA